jgi:hypothetical protein
MVMAVSVSNAGVGTTHFASCPCFASRGKWWCWGARHLQAVELLELGYNASRERG